MCRMRQQGFTCNCSQQNRHLVLAGGGIYCGTKSYIDAFTEAIRHDFVNTQVKVTAVSPGAVQTEFSNVRFKGDDKAANATYEGMQPLLAADIADQVLYAATRYIPFLHPCSLGPLTGSSSNQYVLYMHRLELSAWACGTLRAGAVW